jgi:hypothetical protein
MKIDSIAIIRCVLIFAALLMANPIVNAQQTPGIPEPGLVMYGAVTNSSGGSPVTIGNVNWTVSGGGSTSTVVSTIVNVNGQYFYIARIPFETRSAGGINFGASPNTLPLNDSATFLRIATVRGTNANLVAPATSSFSFRKADRGRVERVDLSVNLGTDPGLDSDGDGVPDWAELIAGTNPSDKNSVFKASSTIQPDVSGGLVIKWSSVTGKSYIVERATDLGQTGGGGFIMLGNNISATGSETQFADTEATGAGPYFYRISVNP